MADAVDVTAPVQVLVREYRAALSWLSGAFGMRTDVGRLRKYSDVCDRLEAASAELWNDKVNLIDITSIVEIWRHRDRLEALPDFASRLEHIARGMQFYSEDKDHTSRNYLFELACGCFLLDVGFPLVAASGDLTATKYGQTILIECKRLSSEKLIERRCREASDQIATRRRKAEVGLIFFDLTLLANPQLKYWEASSREDSVRLMDAEIDRLKVGLHPRTADVVRSRMDAGVVSHLILPYFIPSVPEWVIQERTLMLGNRFATANAKILFDVLELEVERAILGRLGQEWH